MDLTLSNVVFPREVEAATSKSIAHRMLICAAFSNLPSRFKFRRAGDDIFRTLDCLMALGARVEKLRSDGTVLEFLLHPAKDIPSEAILDCGESGSTLRFLLPLAAALGVHAVYQRRGRLAERPLSSLEELLVAAGVNVWTDDEGRLHTEGKLCPGHFELPGHISSQFISGMIFAMSVMDGVSTLRITSRVESAPYIRMTLGVIRNYGVKFSYADAEIRVEGAGQTGLRRPRNYQAEGDWSGAAAFLCAGDVGGHPVKVTGLKLRTLQGDRKVLNILREFGARVYREDDQSVTVGPGRLHGIVIDARDIPDLIPVLCCVAAAASGVTLIRHAERLKLKESDRLGGIYQILSAFGVPVRMTEDGMQISGGTDLHGANVSSFHDHRMAMAVSVMASMLDPDKTVHLTDAECVTKSWPGYWEDLGVIPSGNASADGMAEGALL